MRYYGSKYRSANQIAQIIKNLLKEKKYNALIEPFCGVCRITVKLKDIDIPIIASDICADLILLHKKNQSNQLIPHEITKKEWTELKKSEPSAERAIAGFGSSYAGIFFGGFLPNEGIATYRTLEKIRPAIQGINFFHFDYRQYESMVCHGGYLIYLDPPYEGTVCVFGTKNKFDHDEFWTTVERWVSFNNTVLVSEKSCPLPHEVLYTRVLNNPQRKSQFNEHLFLIKQ